MNEFADMVSEELRCSLANDFWSRISCGDYVELYLIIIIILLFTLIFTVFVKLYSWENCKVHVILNLPREDKILIFLYKRT